MDVRQEPAHDRLARRAAGHHPFGDGDRGGANAGQLLGQMLGFSAGGSFFVGARAPEGGVANLARGLRRGRVAGHGGDGLFHARPAFDAVGMFWKACRVSVFSDRVRRSLETDADLPDGFARLERFDDLAPLVVCAMSHCGPMAYAVRDGPQPSSRTSF